MVIMMMVMVMCVYVVLCNVVVCVCVCVSLEAMSTVWSALDTWENMWNGLDWKLWVLGCTSYLNGKRISLKLKPEPDHRWSCGWSCV